MARADRPARDPGGAGRDATARVEAEGRELIERGRAMVEQAAAFRPEEARGRQDKPRLVKKSLDARTTDSATAAVHALAVALLPHLRDLLSTERNEESMVEVCAVVPGPRRTIMAACRRGEVSGAVRVGRRWLAPRAGVDAWLRSRGPHLVPTPGGDEDELESVRRSLATPGRRRRTR